MKKLFLLTIFSVAVVVGVFALLATSQSTATVKTSGGDLHVRVARTAVMQTKGLSGTHLQTYPYDGMLFVFKQYEQRTFWMKGMHYPLDVVWLRDGKIMKISSDVPVALRGEDIPYMHSRPFEVDMVLELPAGRAKELDLIEGMVLEFEGVRLKK